MTEFKGFCHCGAVQVTASRIPSEVLLCNCSLCAKTGWEGVYFSSDELTISGEVHGYTRSDLATPYLTVFRCATCGIGTHWEPITPPPHARMGVNARLFDPALLAGATRTQVDGRSWPTDA
ncbi:GFA family protein [Sphingomonas sp. ID1715]|uniref:GFA family protein n=1 Tax=Sphingomonas sp. ID1715 TaxID=1656898 RepID=UPI001488A129|nr:GFA family protein [Sphingomonas sp. ID1715]NNM76130.1 GFA family protein [Sphingomonas sp. ID1715]